MTGVNTWNKNCDGSEPQYEYYDLNVGLERTSGSFELPVEEEPFESSGDSSDIFDMPKFEMLIGDDPNSQRQGKINKNPYKETSGPLVAATVYRKYEFSQESRDPEVIENIEKKNANNNLFGKDTTL